MKELKLKAPTEYLILDKASGSSLDWVKGTYGISYTFVYELRDAGRHGFLLPAKKILPTAEETLDSFIVILQKAIVTKK